MHGARVSHPEIVLFRQVMQDVTGQEFNSLMTLLSGLKLAKTIPGQQALVDLAAEQADLGKKATPGVTTQDPSSQAETLAKLVQCIRQALPLFSVSSQLSYSCLLAPRAFWSGRRSGDALQLPLNMPNACACLEE